jgi:hypothetical protein
MIASPTEREISALITRMINKEINSARVICATCVGAGTNKLKVYAQLKLAILSINTSRLGHSV